MTAFEPMTQEELHRIVSLMRAIGKDTQQYEVKSSKKSLPKDIASTISAFANGSGGTIICGLSEKDGFAPVEGFDAQAIQDAFAEICNNKMTPPIRPDISIVPFEGTNVVVSVISELPPVDKPCFITASDKYKGSYIRTGDGDQRLSEYEVDRLLEEHRQPRYDGEIVAEATLNDLDATMLNGVLQRERASHPRNFAKATDEEAIQKLNIAKRDRSGVLRPTLAGLLALGEYPQQFFPRLNVSFTCYPGTSKSDVISAKQRLIDSVTVVGPIPYLVEDTIAAISKNMRNGALIDGAFRKDVPDYPPLALREAIANALMHRDYSPQSLGTPVHVDMYTDRLEISNPGGLYGTMTVNLLGKDHGSSARNQFLSAILESTASPNGGFVVENRGSGYKAIEQELAAALMPPPIPRDTISFFALTFQKRRLSRTERSSTAKEAVNAIVLSLLADQESVTTLEVMNRSGRSRPTVIRHINHMVEEGIIEPMELKRSSKQRYRLSTRKQ